MGPHSGELAVPDGQRIDRSNGSDDDATAESADLDVVFSVLRNSRRRRILRYVDREGSTTLGELATHIAAIENGIEERAVSSDQRKLLYVSLYQSHLPKLGDAGCIDYDSDRGTVEPTDRVDEYLAVLDQFGDESAESPRERGLFSLLGAGLLGVVVALVVLPVGIWVPPGLVAVATIVAAVGALLAIGLSIRHR